MPMPEVGQNQLGGTQRRGLQSTALEEEKPQGSGWRKMDLGQEELRDWPPDPDGAPGSVMRLLSSSALFFPLK